MLTSAFPQAIKCYAADDKNSDDKQTKLIKAEMLDIEGMDAEKILSDAIDSIRCMGV